MALKEITILVPEERVSDFYRVVGAWMSGATLADVGIGARGRRRRLSGDTAPVLSSSSRYAPLHRFLAELDMEIDSYLLSFEEISKIMGVPLPKSASDHRAWWANTESHSQALAWISAGWKVDGVNLEDEKINFVRLPS